MPPPSEDSPDSPKVPPDLAKWVRPCHEKGWVCCAPKALCVRYLFLRRRVSFLPRAMDRPVPVPHQLKKEAPEGRPGSAPSKRMSSNGSPPPMQTIRAAMVTTPGLLLTHTMQRILAQRPGCLPSLLHSLVRSAASIPPEELEALSSRLGELGVSWEEEDELNGMYGHIKLSLSQEIECLILSHNMFISTDELLNGVLALGCTTTGELARLGFPQRAAVPFCQDLQRAMCLFVGYWVALSRRQRTLDRDQLVGVRSVASYVLTRTGWKPGQELGGDASQVKMAYFLEGLVDSTLEGMENAGGFRPHYVVCAKMSEELRKKAERQEACKLAGGAAGAGMEVPNVSECQCAGCYGFCKLVRYNESVRKSRTGNLPDHLHFKRAFQMNPRTLAEQLCLLDSNLLSSVRWGELQGCNWSNPSTRAISAHSLAVIHRMSDLTRWVASAVLRPLDLAERQAVVGYFLEVCTQLESLGNFASTCAIINGLQYSSLMKLQTMKFCQEGDNMYHESFLKWREQINFLSEIFSPDGGFCAYHSLMAQRVATRGSDGNEFCVPALPILQQSLATVDAAQPLFLPWAGEEEVGAPDDDSPGGMECDLPPNCPATQYARNFLEEELTQRRTLLQNLMGKHASGPEGEYDVEAWRNLWSPSNQLKIEETGQTVMDPQVVNWTKVVHSYAVIKEALTFQLPARTVSQEATPTRGQESSGYLFAPKPEALSILTELPGCLSKEELEGLSRKRKERETEATAPLSRTNRVILG